MDRRHFVVLTGTGLTSFAHDWLLDPERVAASVQGTRVDHAVVDDLEQVADDGAAGVAQHGTYDRIITTAAVPEIPLPWIEQLAPAGKILVNLRGEVAGGTLCLLTKDGDDEVIGPVLPLGGHFMWLRPQADSPVRAPEPVRTRSTRLAARTSTALDPSALAGDDSFRFLLQLQLRGAHRFCRTSVHDPRTRTSRDGVLIEARDGSHAEVITAPELGEQRPVL